MPQPPAVSKLSTVVDDGLRRGLHLGAQWCATIDGCVVAAGAVGRARAGVDSVGVDMTDDSILLWLSSSKPIAAAAILQLREAGLLDLDDPVGRHWPEFAANGKHTVTVRHLLTHTGGFRFIDLGGPETSWDEIVQRIAVAPLERNWTPGLRAGYHPYTSWYVLGELVRRLSGLPYSQFVRDRIFLPLEMPDCRIGMTVEERDQYASRLGELANTERRGDAPPTLAPHAWSTPAGLVACAPGGNGHGPTSQLVRFYQMILGRGVRNGVRVLSTESVQAMTARQRTGLVDETFRHELDWGLGMIPNNRRFGLNTVPYGYGRHASDDAVGHSGSQSSVAFCDPQHRLAAAIVLNGTCGERLHQPRMRAVVEALYDDLGIVRAD